MRMTTLGWTALSLSLSISGVLSAQDTSPTPAPTPTPEAAEDSPIKAFKEPKAFRPIESNLIINLPSVEVPTEKTLTLLVTHRFSERIQEGNINNFYTLDDGNEWGFGLWYAPIKNLNVGLYRSQVLNTYEGTIQYQLPGFCGFGWSLRLGEDWRTQPGVAASPKSSFFAQAVLAYSFGQYVRLTVVPTYVQDVNAVDVFGLENPIPGDQSCVPITTGGETTYRCSRYYKNIVNVPFGASVSLTHSITLHGEVIPALSKVNSRGIGWSVSVEKALLRHRFAFTAGNQKQTTVDEYIQAVPGPAPFGHSAKDIYIGFNLFRAWNFK